KTPYLVGEVGGFCLYALRLIQRLFPCAHTEFSDLHTLTRQLAVPTSQRRANRHTQPNERKYDTHISWAHTVEILIIGGKRLIEREPQGDLHELVRVAR